jgi:hypothetical protein
MPHAHHASTPTDDTSAQASRRALLGLAGAGALAAAAAVNSAAAAAPAAAAATRVVPRTPARRGVAGLTRPGHPVGHVGVR